MRYASTIVDTNFIDPNPNDIILICPFVCLLLLLLLLMIIYIVVKRHHHYRYRHLYLENRALAINREDDRVDQRSIDRM